MDASKIVASWRSEWGTKCEELKSRLTEALAMLEAADASLQSKNDEWTSLQAFATAYLQHEEPLCSLLRRELADSQEMQKAASQARTRAVGLVESIRAELLSVKEAIDQADRALAKARVISQRRPEIVPRHRPQMVEFDDIVLPIGAAS